MHSEPPPQPAGSAKTLLQNGPIAPATVLYHGERVPIPPDGLVVGRRSDNHVQLTSHLASRHHARITAADGGYYVSDLESRNGTYLNGECLVGESRWLASGDTIAIGGERLRFVQGEMTRMGASPVRQEPAQHLIRMDRPRMTVGRDASNDVVLDDPNVSCFHAEVEQAKGRTSVSDLGSRNGTRVDGQVVDRASLEAGSEIGIGPYRLIFDGSTFVARDDSGDLRLDAHDLGVVVKGKRILERTNLSVRPGEFVAVIGESGSGKTTLVKALAGVTRPAEGAVTVSGEPVTSRLTDVGYVPQQEIAHGKLTVVEALAYSARLRLPQDASGAEIDSRVQEVISELSLAEHADTRIESLSGGQRKRVGLATELLSKPSLLLLDEPTSGLDPGLESKMMELLRQLADRGRAVVVVTHATKNLAGCDKLAVMGRGGHLAFYGSPPAALEFFRADDYDGIYNAIEGRPAAEWRALFEQTVVATPDGRDGFQPGLAAPGVRASRRERRALTQAGVLADRYVRLLSRDRRNLLILLGQVPLLALGVIGLFDSDVFSRKTGAPQNAAQLLFLLVTVAIWLGSIDAAREIVKERSILLRERAVGVRLSAYLFSKSLVLFSVATLQTLALAGLVLAFRPLDEPAGDYFAVLAILVLTGLVAVAMGLFISAGVRSEDQATSFIPLALIPQLFFAGAIVPLEKMGSAVEALAHLVFAQWSFAGAGTALDMNDRIEADAKFAKVSGYGTEFFDISPGIVTAVLLVFLAAFLAATVLLLRRRAE